ncbi:hypothetical protein [Streptomyces violaceus]|uniref:Uncharacterized protein n=1 Tax=Streptomyces violaceus TaxID=1936 RepID=A0ABY9UMQ0_STRVL|nr:hypothetical protein [Streptomyces janthinus]WND24168.1 hypothetical protein RI060_43385 [Streptomyces janthinus]GGS96718.1 hypothetical protein GCM10010270_80840 [Streptomyces janthinus]
MTTRTRTAKATKTSDTPVPAKKTAAARKTTAAASRPARKRPASKPADDAPKLSLVKPRKPRKPLPVREPNWMTDIQGHATLAARIAGITTPYIRQWIDHHDGTGTRRLLDGTLHYNHTTRTLSWQATCLMGAVHTYPIPTPGAAAAARVLAARCTQLHADLSVTPPLTADELEALGLLTTPTWARPDLLGEEPTQSIPVPDTALTRAKASAADTQSMSTRAIADGLAARADNDQPKEHPQP